MDLSSEENHVIAALLQWERAEEVRAPLLTLMRRSRGVSPSEIAQQLGYTTAQINEWLDRFDHAGLLAVIPTGLREEATRLLADHGLDIASDASPSPDRQQPEPPTPESVSARDQIDERWSYPDSCPIPGCSARTPEGLVLLLATEKPAPDSEPVDCDLLAEWLSQHGCTPERVETWLTRIRCVEQAERRAGPPSDGVIR